MNAFAGDGIHHITLRVADLERSRRFYGDLLGLSQDQDLPGKIRFRLWNGAGATRLVLKEPIPGTPDGDRFTKRRIGLDHVALAAAPGADLEALATRLRQAGVPCEGVVDVNGGGRRVAFRDPDNIEWELFGD